MKGYLGVSIDALTFPSICLVILSLSAIHRRVVAESPLTLSLSVLLYGEPVVLWSGLPSSLPKLHYLKLNRVSFTTRYLPEQHNCTEYHRYATGACLINSPLLSWICANYCETNSIIAVHFVQENVCFFLISLKFRWKIFYWFNCPPTPLHGYVTDLAGSELHFFFGKAMLALI